MTMIRLHETDDATSRKMRAVRQAGTSPELAVRDALESLGIEFEANVEGKPGRPDIWIVDGDIPVFVHGCFWHRHEGCKKATTPKRNQEYWTVKFQQNVERDSRKALELRALGYYPFTVWQCETNGQSALATLLTERIEKARKGARR